MHNSEAQAYACVALNNLINAGLIKTNNNKKLLNDLDKEMYYLFDRFSEDEITEKFNRIMINNS